MKTFTLFFLVCMATGFCKSAEDAVLEFFYLSARACAEGNAELIRDFIPAEGFILVDHTHPDAKEIHVSKENALQHQTTAVTDLLRSGKLHSVTLPKSIEVDGEHITVHAEMIEVSLVEGKQVAGFSKIRSEYRFRDDRLLILKSEMMENTSYPLKVPDTVEQGATAHP